MTEAPQAIGPYRVVKRLGSGGMAETFIAIKHGPGGYEQRVCLKRIRAELSPDPEYVRQFMDEARIAAGLRHANLAQVLDFGQQGDDYWLALELIDGLDLRALLDRAGGTLDGELVALLAVELAKALDVARRGGNDSDTHGVVHRDVSPANVLLSIEGEVKLTDFGIAKRRGDLSHTRTGIIKGKAPYMAPEYAEHGRFDHRSDLFGLGVLLYECLAGRRPYQGATDLDTINRAILGEHTPLAELAPDASTPLVDAVERLIVPDPERRFATSAELLDALRPIEPAAATTGRALASLVRELRGPAVPDDGPEQKTVPARAQPADPGRTTRTTPLLGEAAATAPVPAGPRRPWLPRAAGLIMLTALALWSFQGERTTGATAEIQPAATLTAPPSAPRAETPGPAPTDGGASTPATAIDPGHAPHPTDAATAAAAAAEALLAHLTVVVIPYGQVSVDGRAPRQAPLRMSLKPGTHRIVAELRGSRIEQRVRLAPGQRKRLVLR